MIKKMLITLVFTLFFGNLSLAAGGDGSSTKSNYDKAVKLIKSAKKYEADGKTKKADDRYKKAFKLLVKSNKEKPGKADTLNYLGFTSRKLGDFENAEIFYTKGLEISPYHIRINQYMGELYVTTNQIDKAKERLAVLDGCDCKEYTLLKDCLLYTSPSPRDRQKSRMPSSA